MMLDITRQNGNLGFRKMMISMESAIQFGMKFQGSSFRNIVRVVVAFCMSSFRIEKKNRIVLY